jgi:TolB-like protein
VAVLPFFCAEGVGRSAGVMGESMAAGLRELGLHEVVLVSPETRDRLIPHDVVMANRMRAEDLLTIRDELRVDAVLLGRVEQFDSFDPIAMGVTCALVSCKDGEVLWSATGHFDGHRQDIQDEVRHWYQRTLSAQANPISGWKVVLQSPKLFSRYIAERLAQSIPVKPD